MKTIYTKPEISIVELDCESIICGSDFSSVLDAIVSGREDEED